MSVSGVVLPADGLTVVDQGRAGESREQRAVGAEHHALAQTGSDPGGETMPWELRGAKRYYYQPVWVNGQPRRIYWGSGDAGRLHELLTLKDRRLRKKRAAAAREKTVTVKALQRDTRAVLTRVRELVRATRLIGGEYQHHGEWRWRAGRRHGRLDLCGRVPVKVTSPVRPSGFVPPSPFLPENAMTPVPSRSPPTPADVGRQLIALNDRANRGDRSALIELEEVLDLHPEVWQTAARLSSDTASGWGRLLGDGGAVTEACLRREVLAWKAGLAGPDPTPLVTAAVDAAAVAWLAQRFAEREVFQAVDKKRTAAVKQLGMANRQLQDAIKLVIIARSTAESAKKQSPNSAAAGATGPRLFGGAAG